MRYSFLLIIFLFLGNMLSAQENTREDIPFSRSAKDSARVMKFTRVTQVCNYLSQREKDAIQWMNIARMYPKWFLYFRKIKDKEAQYTHTLIQTMMTMKPIEHKLIPSKRMWECAQCHAKTTGPTGFIGHARQDTLCKRWYSAECIHYGGGTAAKKVERLLIDYNVPSLGHRKSILNRRLKKVGVSIMPHGKNSYSEMIVIDFSR